MDIDYNTNSIFSTIHVISIKKELSIFLNSIYNFIVGKSNVGIILQIFNVKDESF